VQGDVCVCSEKLKPVLGLCIGDVYLGCVLLPTLLSQQILCESAVVT
jgi:hypothetical protein